MYANQCTYSELSGHLVQAITIVDIGGQQQRKVLIIVMGRFQETILISFKLNTSI